MAKGALFSVLALMIGVTSVSTSTTFAVEETMILVEEDAGEGSAASISWNAEEALRGGIYVVFDPDAISAAVAFEGDIASEEIKCDIEEHVARAIEAAAAATKDVKAILVAAASIQKEIETYHSSADDLPFVRGLKLGIEEKSKRVTIISDLINLEMQKTRDAADSLSKGVACRVAALQRTAQQAADLVTDYADRIAKIKGEIEKKTSPVAIADSMMELAEREVEKRELERYNSRLPRTSPPYSIGRDEEQLLQVQLCLAKREANRVREKVVAAHRRTLAAPELQQYVPH